MISLMTLSVIGAESWLGYNTKRCMFPKKEVIDWENVLVPTSSQSILG